MSTTTTPVNVDRLLDHFTDIAFRVRGDMYDFDKEKIRAEIDADPRMQVRLGRVGGQYEYLRALVLAGIATSDERDWLNEYGG